MTCLWPCFRTETDSGGDSSAEEDDEDVDGRSVDGGMDFVIEATSTMGLQGWLQQQQQQQHPQHTRPHQYARQADWGNMMGGMGALMGFGQPGGGGNIPVIDAASSDPIVGGVTDGLDWSRGISPLGSLDVAAMIGGSGNGGRDGCGGGSVAEAAAGDGMMLRSPLGRLPLGLDGVKEEEEEDAMLPVVASHEDLADGGLLGGGGGGCLLNLPMRVESPATGALAAAATAAAAAGAPPGAWDRSNSPLPAWGFLDVSPHCLASLKVCRVPNIFFVW